MAASTSGRLRLVIVTPQVQLLELECDSVSLPARLGYVTLLPGHTPLISTLATGVLSQTGGSGVRQLAIAGGFFEISNDVVTVLADEAFLPDQVDRAATEQALATARSALTETSGEELWQARQEIKRAEAKLAIL